jgi:RHS repeat-associated protein
MVHTYTEYCGNHILENGKLKQSLFDGGYITYSDGEPEFHFYVRDHQGNNRLVMSEDGVVEQVNDYTPFGVQMKNSFTATSSQRYKYNGKELDRMFGLDLYDYGARFYDARIARWQNIDPLCEKYYSISPYVYCANNPIRFIDYKGKFATEAEAKEYADLHYPGATPLKDTATNQWFITLNKDKTGRYVSGPILTREFGKNNPYRMENSTLNSILSAYNIENGAKLSLIDYALNGEDIGAYTKFFKGIGRAINVYSFCSAVSNFCYYMNSGGNSKFTQLKYLMDAVMAAASFSGNPIVLIITSTYFLVDIATAGFGLDYSVETPQVESENNSNTEENDENQKKNEENQTGTN